MPSNALHLLPLRASSAHLRPKPLHTLFFSQRKVVAVSQKMFSSINEESNSLSTQRQVDFDPSEELFGVDAGVTRRDVASGSSKTRSWFGPNGQYIRELPCPSCRGRGYTPCTECGIERSRLDCAQCNGKGLMTCKQCLGDCVIWEESIDERPWEKAHSSSPLTVKEDIEVDDLDIKLDPTRKSKRIYQSPPPEVGLKISRSLRSLNAKTGLFSKRMKIIHRNPKLHAQRVAAIKKAKSTAAARKRASEALKIFFSNPENRLKRSMAMKGVKFYCSNCGKEGHRRHYCPELKDKTEGSYKYKCRICGEKGHNQRTCVKLDSARSQAGLMKSRIYHCKLCGEHGHNSRSCSKKAQVEAVGVSELNEVGALISKSRTYTCKLCFGKGHNRRTCPSKKTQLYGPLKT